MAKRRDKMLELKLERYIIAMLVLLLVIFLIAVFPSGLSETSKLNFVLVTNLGMFGGTVAVAIDVLKSGKKKEKREN